MSKSNKGYTLLFAVLVSSIVLSIGISILTISKKEFQLSVSAKDSTLAFYAADSGLECALYYNDNPPYFSTSTDSHNFNCADYNINDSKVSSGSDEPYEYTFQLPVGFSGACAIIIVEKYYDADDVSTVSIFSRGYNTGWDGDSCDESSSRRVERALELTY